MVKIELYKNKYFSNYETYRLLPIFKFSLIVELLFSLIAILLHSSLIKGKKKEQFFFSILKNKITISLFWSSLFSFLLIDFDAKEVF